MNEPVILVLGPSFVGKTTFFNSFVERNSIRNHYYPGTNIQVNTGYVTLEKKRYSVVDTPGIYNLIPNSENEIVTLRLILELKPEKIVFVTSEEHIEHTLLIMIQLAELNIPFLVTFYRKNDFAPVSVLYDKEKIFTTFNTTATYITPVIGKGLSTTKKKLLTLTPPRWVGAYDPVIENTLVDFERKFRFALQGHFDLSVRFLGILLILGNQPTLSWLKKNLNEQVWQMLDDYQEKNIRSTYSFLIANRWKQLAENLTHDVILDHKPYKPKYFILLDKYSLTFFWDSVLIFFTGLIWIGLMQFFANKLLVNLFYNELYGKYLEPFFTHFISLLFGESLLAQAITGPYGIFTIGVSYAFAIILPSVLVFFFIYALLDELGYLLRIAISLNRLLSFFGLTSTFIPHLLMGCSCKIMAGLKARTLETPREKFLAILLLCFSVPCFSQFAIIANLLSIIPQQYVLIYFITMFIQFFFIIRLAQWLYPGPRSAFITRVTPLKITSFMVVFQKTSMYVVWYLREIVPLILLSALGLFLLDITHVLEVLKILVTPLITLGLALPEKFAETVILGLVRKDFGAVSIYDLANNGYLNSIQILVATTFLSLSIPCVGFLGAVRKIQGSKTMVLLLLGSTIYAFAIAGLLNWLLRL